VKWSRILTPIGDWC